MNEQVPQDDALAPYVIHTAGPFHLWAFRMLARFVTRTPEVYGCYFPWGLFVVEEHADKEWLIRHEIQHTIQRRREGFVKYWVKTFWYIYKHGYVNSPFEIEARAAQNDTRISGWTIRRRRLRYDTENAA